MTTEQHYHIYSDRGVKTSEHGYLTLLAKIMRDGTGKSDRTGTGTRSLFGEQLRFDLAAGFPLLTTKRVHTKSVIHELLWFIAGSTNERELSKHGVNIWREWAREDGDLGPIYGKQWRNWSMLYAQGPEAEVPSRFQTGDSTMVWMRGFGSVVSRRIDQLANVIKTNPDCRRLIVFYIANGRLSCHMYQRSADMFLGVPFNIASYALLTQVMAHVTGLGLGELVISFGDAHVYSNHFDQVREQLNREPRPLPAMQIRRQVETIDDFRYEDFELLGYDPHPAIKAPVAV